MAACLHFTLLHSPPAAGQQSGTGPTANARLMVVIHGVLSSGKMYKDMAQGAIYRAAETTGCPWTAVLVDQRNHGGSWGKESLEEPHTADASADDIARLLSWGHHTQGWGKPEVIIGHSLGGVVALRLADRLAQAASGKAPAEVAELGVPKQVWVLDSRAFPVQPDTPLRQAFSGFIKVLGAVPEPMESEEPMMKAASAYLAAAGEAFVGSAAAHPPWLRPLMQHILKPNPAGPGFVRQYDTPAILAMLDSFHTTDCTAVLKDPPPGCSFHIVWGQTSDVWTAEDAHEEMEFMRERSAAGKQIKVHEVPGDHMFPLSHAAQLLEVMGQEFKAL